MRWRWTLFWGVLLFVLVGAAIWQYMPEAKEKGEIRKAVKVYLRERMYFNPQIMDIRIAHNYAVAIAYEGDTRFLFLRKRGGKWEVLEDSNLLSRDYLADKYKVPEEILKELRLPAAGSFE